MFSVIIPTMWRGVYLAYMFERILANKEVSEIIVIDNDRAHRPSAFKRFLSHSKVKMIDHGQNIYVNPAWNLGVECSKFEQICLLSDDILFDPDLFSQLTPLCTEDRGVFGIASYTFQKTPKIQCGLSVRLDPITSSIPLTGWGCAMFMHKSAYANIPSCLRIFYGDNWLYLKNKKRGVDNYYLGGIEVYTEMCTTNRDECFIPIKLDDQSAAGTVFAIEFGVTYIPWSTP